MVKRDHSEVAIEEEIVEKLMAEAGGLVPPGFAQQIEDDFTKGNMGTARRLAMVFLEKQFSESFENAQRDRKTAEAFASIQLFIRDYVQNYELLLGWLAAADIRLMAAVCAREDSGVIFAEADREHANLTKGKLQ